VRAQVVECQTRKINVRRCLATQHGDGHADLVPTWNPNDARSLGRSHSVCSAAGIVSYGWLAASSLGQKRVSIRSQASKAPKTGWSHAAARGFHVDSGRGRRRMQHVSLAALGLVRVQTWDRAAQFKSWLLLASTERRHNGEGTGFG
jgi:hypothetical protein